MTIYDREGGVLQRVVHADRADPQGGDWKLEDVRIYDSTMNVVRRLPKRPRSTGVQPEQLTLAKVDPDQLDFWTLKERIAQLEQPDARPTRPRPACGTRFPVRFRPC